MPKTKTRELKLFVDGEGTLWFGDGTRNANASNLGPREFISQDWLQAFERIQVLGFSTNARLICELLNKRGASPDMLPAIIQVGTPSVCSSAAARSDPNVVMRQMAEVHTRPPSLGGWHEVTIQDFIQYGLLLELEETGGEYSAAIGRLMSIHPAWPALSFIPSRDEGMGAKMLAIIRDPRWYADVVHPNRTSKLFSYLGLMEGNMSSVTGGFLEDNKKAKGMHADRADIVFRSWACGKSHAEDNTPEGFLWRVLAEAPTKQKGMLKACKRYVSLVRNVWLDNLAAPGRTLFVPEYFFDKKEEAEAYRYHLKKLKAGNNA